MKKTGYLGLSLLLISALALPGLTQQAPAYKSTAEGNAYLTLYNEQNPQKKAELGEKFLTDFKDSDFRPQAFQMVIRSYANAQNWAKVMETADKLSTLVPNADNNTKLFAYENAMLAGQQSNQFPKIIEYGDKVLATDPNNLNAQITISSMLPERLPTDEAGKKAALDQAFDLASKAQAQLPKIFAQKPAQFTDAQWNQERSNLDGQLNATLGLVHLNRLEYDKSTERYEAALKSNPKDGVSQYRLGISYQSLASAASKDLLEAYNAENAAKAARADQIQQDELVARRQALEEDVRVKRDKAIDALAKAVAIGGVVAQPAREQLERMWKAKNNDSVEGLEQFINEKKAQLV
jgi:tetratricopeptide (TPR) repeat protein